MKKETFKFNISALEFLPSNIKLIANFRSNEI